MTSVWHVWGWAQLGAPCTAATFFFLSIQVWKKGNAFLFLFTSILKINPKEEKIPYTYFLNQDFTDKNCYSECILELSTA